MEDKITLNLPTPFWFNGAGSIENGPFYPLDSTEDYHVDPESSMQIHWKANNIPFPCGCVEDAIKDLWDKRENLKCSSPVLNIIKFYFREINILPDDSRQFLLELILERQKTGFDKMLYDIMSEEIDPVVKYGVLQVLDDMELIEHGGSMSGSWLTCSGKAISKIEDIPNTHPDEKLYEPPKINIQLRSFEELLIKND